MSLSPPSFVRRALPVAITLIASSPLLGAVLWYQLGLLAVAQIGALRTLGLLGVFWLFTSVAGGLLALGLTALRLEARWRGWPRVGRIGLFAACTMSMAALGLTVFYWSPSLAPLGAQIAAAGAALTLIGAFLRYPEELQRMLLRIMTGLGLTAIATPCLLAPWLLFDAFTSRPPRIAAPAPERPLVKADAPRRILLLTFDGLRAESTSLHSPALKTTPAVETLARSSAWFTEARALSDSTLVSLPAIFSGTHPSLFLPYVKNEMRLVPDGLLTGIAGYMRQAGYRTLYTTMFLTPGSSSRSSVARRAPT
ncbi:MAG: sulfatase-like hydrolase/transferase [Candidatus Sericytochromatia bacterium]